VNDAGSPPRGDDPVNPDDVFVAPARYGLESAARAWGVFEFAELRGLYSTRELAEEMAKVWVAGWKALPASAWAPGWYPEAALTIREVQIFGRK